MFNAGYNTQEETELNQVIWSLAPTWRAGAHNLGWQALEETGRTDPYPARELLDRVTVLAREAIDETQADLRARAARPATLTFTIPMDPKIMGRLCKALDRRFMCSDNKVRTLRQRLEQRTPLHKKEYIRHYARHKRDGCNAKLAAPKHEYTVWYLDDDGRDFGIGVPKLVFDALEDVPEKERTEEAHD